jgi:two-component system LytT family response regulator
VSPAAARVRTLIVDDEPLARRRLRSLLSGEPALEIIGEAASGPAAVTAIRGERPDLVLLDIQMPGKDGFDVLQDIAGVHEPVVIFVTAHDEHAMRAFDVQALDYVLKPVIEDRLRAAVRRALDRLAERGRGESSAAIAALLEQMRPRGAARIPVKRDGRIVFVDAADIQWAEADGDLVRLHTGRGVHVVRMTMAEIEARLGDRRFARVHRSAIVNVDSIREIQPMFKGDFVIVLRSGATVRTGRAYRDIVRGLADGEPR